MVKIGMLFAFASTNTSLCFDHGTVVGTIRNQDDRLGSLRKGGWRLSM